MSGRARATKEQWAGAQVAPARRVTLRDVAERAQVHPGTVSRVLNDATTALVRPDTAARVRSAARALGYRANPLARGLRTSRSDTVGVLVPDIQNPLFPPIVRGIEDRLERDGLTALLANTGNDPGRERSDVRTMNTCRVDGFISATARLDDALLDAVDVPVVLVNRRADDRGVPSVTVDEARGMDLAVAHVAALGHRSVAHVGGPQELSTGRRRAEAFAVAMRRAGLRVETRLIRHAPTFTAQHGAEACRALLDEGLPFTAIVAAADLLAVGCYDALAERGLGCPGDVSVVGFNDMPFADRFRPPLTTVRIPHYAVGAAAANLLLAQLTQADPSPTPVVLPPSLVVRGSTAMRP